MLSTRIQEHKRAVQRDDELNACTIHRNQEGHIMKWDNAQYLIKENEKRRRKCLEAIIIENKPTIQQKRGSYNVAGPLGQMILKNISSDQPLTSFRSTTASAT